MFGQAERGLKMRLAGLAAVLAAVLTRRERSQDILNLYPAVLQPNFNEVN